MKRISTQIVLGMLVSCLTMIPGFISAQPCSGGTEFGGPLVSMGAGSSQTVPTLAAGEYFRLYVCNGSQYTIHTCPENSFNTYLTLINDATLAFLADNDDSCGSPIADQASVTWTATFTGWIRVLLTESIIGNGCVVNPLSIADVTVDQVTGGSCAPPGYICSSAQVITSPFTSSGATTCGAGDNYDETMAGACAANDFYLNADDYVYSFTPSATQCYEIELTSPGNWMGFFIFQGCPDMGGSCIASSVSANPPIDPVNITLTAGIQYYIIVSGNPNGVSPLGAQCNAFTLTLNTCPPGSSCSDPLIVSGTPYSMTGLTTCNTTNDYSNSSSCGSFYMDGPEYVIAYTPSQTTCHSVDIAGSGAVGLFIWDMCNAGATCLAFDESNTGDPSIQIDFMAGVTYYLLVSTDPDILFGNTPCTAFDISISTCPTGSVCSVAEVITPGFNSGPATTCGSGDDYEEFMAGACGGNDFYLDGDDYVYEFTPAATDCYRFDMPSSGNWTGFFIFNGCPGEVGTTCVNSSAAGNPPPSPLSVTLNAGTTYYIVVSTNPDGVSPLGAQCGPYQLTMDVCPPGAACGNPFNIASAPFSQNGMTTCGFGNDYVTSSCGNNNYLGGEDFVMDFTPSTSGCYNLNFTNTDDYLGVFVWDNCPDSGTNCVGAANSTTDNTTLDVYLDAGTTYYFIVDTWPLPDCSAFDFALTECSQDGETCATPIVLAGGSATGVTSCAMGDNYDNFDACMSNGMNGQDVVFSYTAPSDGCYDVDVTNPTNTAANGGLFVLDGCPDVGGTNCVGSTTLTSGVAGTTVNLTGGVTYTIVVATNDPECTGFNINVSLGTCPPGNLCANPEVINPGSVPYTIPNLTTCGSGNDYTPAQLCGEVYGDAEDFVLSFTPTVTDCYTFDMQANGGTNAAADVGLFVLDACPDAGANCIASATLDNGLPMVDAYLSAGVTYYIVASAIEFTTPILYNSSCTDFDMMISSGGAGCPAGVNCSNPLTVMTGLNPAIDLCGSGDDYGQTDACMGFYMSGEEIILTYTPSSTDCYNIATSMTANSNAAADVGLYVMTHCPDDPMSSCLVNEEVENGFPDVDVTLNAGTTYYIVVAAVELITPAAAMTSCTEVDLTITPGSANCPPGLTCGNPINLPSPGFYPGNTSCGFGDDYSQADIAGCNTAFDFALNAEETVMTFTPGTSGCYLFATSNGSNPAADPALFIFDACPDTGPNCIATGFQENGMPSTTAELIAGQQYYVVFSAIEITGTVGGNFVYSSSCTNFDISISSCPPQAPVQDCNGAIPVCQSSYTYADGFIGGGFDPNEIPGGTCLSTGELNSVWFTINVESSGDLSFLITPQDAADDYDFAVFDITNNGCMGIPTGASPLLSCNYSISAGVTGASGPSMPGSPLNNQDAAGTLINPSVAVTAGQTITIIVSNFNTSTDGFTIDLTASTADVFDVTPPDFDTVTDPVTCNSTTLDVVFDEPITCFSVAACDFNVTFPDASVHAVNAIASTDCDSGGNFSTDFTLTVDAPMDQNGTYTLTLGNGCGGVEDNCGNIQSNTTITFDVNDCTACMISNMVSNILCDDNGTPSDPTDDTYTFDVTVTGTDTGASWSADDPSSTTGSYGVATSFGPYPISGGDISFTVTDVADPTCTTPVMATAPATCSDLCDIDAVASNIVCDDNGTPADPSDDTYTFEITVTGLNTGATWTADDPGMTSGSYGVATSFGPYPISGGSVTLTITDVDDPACMDMVTANVPMTCSGACTISNTVSNILCDDNGTPSDPSDDTFTFDVVVTGSNTGASWTADDPNSTTGAYGTSVSFGPYPISGGNLNFTITDIDDVACTTPVMVTAPATCSDLCDISASVSNILCNDNGTASDPSDDTFTFDVVVTGMNTGASWTADDPNSTTGSYGATVNFGPYPISGGNLSFTITDITDGMCTDAVMVTAPNTCSGTCNIGNNVTNILCNDNGTPSDPSDDTYTFDVTVTGSNTGASWTADDPNSTTGGYGAAVSFGPYPISGGNLNFTITDIDDAGCTTAVSVTAPATCSDQCTITASASNILCNDNGTPSDPSDDTFTFDVTVTGMNTGASWTADDPNSTTGGYGAAVSFGPYPISGGNLNFTITDIADAACTDAVMVTAPAPCSNNCLIMHTVSNILCDDNGTPSDPSDDTFTFDVNVSGSNTGASWTADDPNSTTGVYGINVNFGPYPISGGNLNFTITDIDDAGCTTAVSVTAPATCSDQCTISNMVANILCDDNGTPSDPSDDTFTFEVTVTGMNTGSTWIANDPNSTAGSYGVSTTFGPYNISGGSLSFVITDIDDAGCTTPVMVTPPATCSDQCTISAATSNILCNDNGTPSDPSDDTFTFNVTVTGMNTGATWTADDPNSTTGGYGSSVSFGPYPISGGNLSFTITDIDDAACTDAVMVTAPAPCSGTCNIGNSVSNIVCDDNGTPSDPSDDTFTFDVTVTGSNTGATWTADDPNSTTGGYGSSVSFGPYPISGGALNFTITDVDDVACTTGVMVSPPATCSNECTIMSNTSNIVCDDNGTPSDPSDDTFTFDIIVTGSNTGSSWNADDPNSTTGSYGVSVSFGPYPISGGNLNFTITDGNDAMCTTTVMVNAPATCSDQCTIMATSSNILCDDNGTPSDPSDDTFTFDVTVTGSNTGATWMADDANSTTGSYGVSTSFGPFPISGGNLSITITDVDDAGCTDNISIIAPMTCSGACDISSTTSNILCDDNGTPSDPSDDTFTFDVTVTGSNSGASWTANDPNATTGTYGVAVNFGPYNISGGNLSFTITDIDDAGCTTPVSVTAPATCSDQCIIMASASNIQCNDNGTPSDPSDDTFTFNVTVTGSNTGASWTADDPNSTTGGYGAAVSFGPYPISGGNLNFTITDIDDAGCTTPVTVNAPAPCSGTCSIGNTVSNIMCDDNGTPSDPSDDTYTFDVLVTGSNTGATWSADDPNSTTGNYGVTVSFGPYPISGGNLNFTITDVDDPLCTTAVMVNAPATCSNECMISAATSNILCDDNGTPSDPSDDTFTFDITVTGLNTGSTWTANDPNNESGSYGVATTFGPFNISGGDIIFTIMDNVDNMCTTPVSVSPPATCSDQCDISATASNIVCDDNGTPSDPSDDTFTFDVTVTGSNTGASWTADDPNSTAGGYGAAVSFGPYNISAGDLNFTITDIDNAGCTANVMVSAPPACSDQCEIMASVSNILCDDNGTPTDPSDDTFTFDVDVTGSNTGSSWTANDPNSTIGNYGVTESFGPFNISGGNISFTITDANDAMCTANVMVTAPPACSDLCMIDAVTSNILCNDNGTPTDPSDDTYTFNVTVTGSNTGASWTADDPMSTTGVYGTAVSFGPYNISDGNLAFTITDIDDAGCTDMVNVTPPNTCSGTCSIGNTVSNIVCDDNGTPSDPSDDTFTFDVVVTGSNTGASWSADDPNSTTGSYGITTGFGPYPISGGNLNFTISDIDDAGCTTTVTVNAPPTCSNECMISATTSNIQCDDNGTPSDPSDDTFTFSIVVTGDNTGSSWTANDPNATGGSYGATVSFGPYPISGGNLNFTITDNIDGTCTTTVNVTAPATCSDQCIINAATSNILCDDNGTPSDPSDDTFTFDVTVTGDNTGISWTADDPNSTNGSYGVVVSFGPYPISGGNLNFTITDNVDAGCTAAVTVTAPATCSDQCMISASTSNILCDDNGTPSDPTDDTFTFDVTVTGSNTGATWTANDPNATSGNYGVSVSFGPYPISGGNLNFSITDAASAGCSAPVNVMAPPTCSDNCVINAVVSNIQCNDNGTAVDPSDDTYTFDVVVTGSNTGASWTANDPNGTAGSYGNTVSFGPYPISGGNLNFTVTDVDDSGCTTNVNVIAPNTCSGTCSIGHTVSGIVCDDNGTPSDPSDDTYTFSVTVTGSNTGTGWTANDPNATSGSYGSAQLFGPYPISSGNLNFTITDADDPMCTTLVSVTAPPTCSDMCTISASTSNIICNDNGTPSDPGDDTFTFNVVVTGDNTGSTWTANDPNGTSGSYGVVVSFGPYPISGGDINFTIMDNIDNGCTTPVMVTAPAPCSDNCIIDAITSNIQCNNNGTPSDPSDDTYTFDVLVTGSNSGASWLADDPNGTSGTYGVAVSFGPYPISAGNLNITITDIDDPACTDMINVVAPSTCSNLCDIDAMVSAPVCNDNGTPNNPSDDTFTFQVTVTGVNTGSSWTANDPNGTVGSYNVPVNFGPYPISGGNLNFTVTDASSSGCTVPISVMAPPSCSDNCTINAVVSNIQCNDNGTAVDPSDDTFTFDVVVTGSNTGAGWVANDPNATAGTYGTSVTFGPYPISGGNLNFIIADIDDNGCNTPVNVVTPMTCSGTCSIGNTVSNIQCDDNGTPSDPSDDTFTFNVLVSGSNTGAGWTANDPNATAGTYGTAMVFGPYSVSNGNLNFTITDVDDPTCTTTVNVTAPATCSDLCTIDAVVSDIMCNNNGTPVDPSDDTFTFNVVVTGSNTALSWTANDPNATGGSYNTSISFGPYPISGGDLTFNITDNNDSGCTTAVMVTAPATCSDNCTLSVVTSNIVCNDNGTSTDPSDDTFTFDVTVTGSNTGASWTANDPNGSSGPYNVAVNMGPYPINGGNLNFTISDIDNTGCSSPVNVIPPATCSNDCMISAAVSNILCNDNGTPLDPADDTFTFVVNVTGVNVGASWTADDPNGTSGSYGNNVTFGPYPISGGNLNFTVADIDDNTCTFDVDVTAPNTCSGSCSIGNSVSDILCDDNGTPSDPSDDTFTFNVMVTGSNTGASWTADDPNTTSGGYNTAINFGPYPISGGNLNFTISDADDASCTTMVSVNAPSACSDLCTINATTSNIMCNDNGTPADPGDDTYTFDVVVTGSNTGASWTANDPNGTSGSYGAVVNFGPYPVSGGNLNFTITDNLDAGCTTTASATAPATCSGDVCSITATVGNSQCDDNGTPTDPGDDTFTFSVEVTGMTTGAGWTANDPNMTFGTYGNLIIFGPYLISDGDLNITITDTDDSACTFSFTAVAPAPCSNDNCSINAVVGQPDCDDNGTPADSSDDTFTFTVEVDGSNTGSGWSADDPDMNSGTYGNLVVFGPYPITGGDLNITITDNDDAACITSFMVNAPPTCSDLGCTISHVADNVSCSDNGTPTDPSDDTFTFDVIVSGSNGGASWVANDPDGSSGNFGTLVTFGPYPISGGNINFTIFDVDDNTCFTDVSVMAPAPCSGQCQITASLNGTMCDDNGTPIDPSDDTFTFEVNVNGINSGSGWTADDANGTTGVYGTTTTFGPYPISGGVLNITLTDNDDPGCTANFSVNPPLPCSGTCSISYSISDITCDDAGTPDVSGDDQYTFNVTVTGANTAASWTADDPNSTTGNYNTTTTFGPYQISDGILSFNITDADDSACTIQVSVTPPDVCSQCVVTADLGPDVTLTCDDPSTVLNVQYTGVPSDLVSFEWTGPDPDLTQNVQMQTIDVPGTYTVTVVHPEGCSETASVVLTGSGLPTADITGGGSIFCTNPCVTLTAGSNLGNAVWLWTGPGINGMTSESVEVCQAGTYTLVATNPIDGCSSPVASITVDEEDALELSIDSEAFTIPQGDATQLEIITNRPDADIVSISWTPDEMIDCTDCMIVTVTPNVSTTYFVEVEDIYGCIETTEVTVNVTLKTAIYMANVFSPNDDGFNDVLTVKGDQNIVNVNVFTVFDRWGNLVFKLEDFTADGSQGWNGEYKGEPVNPGVYIWVAEIVTSAGDTAVFKGDVTVVR